MRVTLLAPRSGLPWNDGKVDPDEADAVVLDRLRAICAGFPGADEGERHQAGE